MAGGRDDPAILISVCHETLYQRQLSSLGAVGPVVYALNEFSPLSSFVIRCPFGDLIIHCRQPGRGGIILT